MSRNRKKVDDGLDIQDISCKLDELCQAMQDMKKAVEFISSQHDIFLSKLNEIVDIQKEQSKEIKANRKIIDKLTLENEHLHHQTKKLQNHLNQLDQYGRRENIELHGVEEKKNENLYQIAQDLAEQLKLPLPTNSITSIHRMKKPIRNRNNRPAPIIIRFTSRKISEEWVLKKKTGITNKNIIEKGTDTEIYINENLSPAIKELYWQARIRGKELKYSFVWVKRGQIFMKKEELQPAIKISNYEDLPKIGNQNGKSVNN